MPGGRIIVKLPDDQFLGQPRSRSVRLERTRPRSIMVNRYGRRFANEAADYNSLGGAFHQFDPGRFEYPNLPAWMVFDQTHLDEYGFLGVSAGDPMPGLVQPLERPVRTRDEGRN